MPMVRLGMKNALLSIQTSEIETIYTIELTAHNVLNLPFCSHRAGYINNSLTRRLRARKREKMA